MLLHTHFPRHQQWAWGSATILFIYMCQYTHFSHYSLSQVSVLANKSTLSHLKTNVPHIWIMDFSVCLFQKKKVAAIAQPHPTKWQDSFSLWGTPSDSYTEPYRPPTESHGGHRHKGHHQGYGTDLGLFTELTIWEARSRKGHSEDFPRSFYGLIKTLLCLPLWFALFRSFFKG